MIFERTERLSADQLPYEQRRTFRLTHHFAFTTAKSPRATIQQTQLADVRLFRARSTGHHIRLTDQDHTIFLLPRRGTIEVRTQRATFVGRPGDALLFAPNERATRVAPDSAGEFTADCLLVPTAMVAEADASAPSHLPPHSSEQLFSAGHDAALRSYLGFLFEEGMRSASSLSSPKVRCAAGALLQELLRELIDRLTATGGADRLATAQDVRLVRLAEDLMLADLDQPLSVGGLAGRLGVSVRRLQYAFQSVRQATPRTVLCWFRLEAARERLADPHEHRTVTQVALDCGVAHLGRFARAYAGRYGEPPSETLRRAQRR